MAFGFVAPSRRRHRLLRHVVRRLQSRADLPEGDPVDHLQERLGARFDRVRVHAPAAELAAVVFDLHDRVALGVRNPGQYGSCPTDHYCLRDETARNQSGPVRQGIEFTAPSSRPLDLPVLLPRDRKTTDEAGDEASLSADPGLAGLLGGPIGSGPPDLGTFNSRMSQTHFVTAKIICPEDRNKKPEDRWPNRPIDVKPTITGKPPRPDSQW